MEPDQGDSPHPFGSRIAIGVLAKAPVAGRVKTRLASLLGTEGCARFQSACLLDVIRRASALSREVTFFGEPVDRAREFVLEHRLSTSVSAQADGDLGARIARAFAKLFEPRTVLAALIVGSDSPDLPREHWLGAARALRAAEMALGPAEDGGYYLVGLRRGEWMTEGKAIARLFDEIPWSSDDTFARQRERAGGRGLQVATLAPWADVDTVSDLARLRHRLRGGTTPAEFSAVRDFCLEFFGEA
ncbi:MAG: TIGR04282 family arsenosugar biosynthesis glycosyltransferase [Candidatus Eisenbacteria bacterium]